MEEEPPVWGVAVNVLNEQSRTTGKGWSSAWELGKVLTTPHPKNWPCYKTDPFALGLDLSFVTT